MDLQKIFVCVQQKKVIHIWYGMRAMESTISLLSEKHFLCSLCEEIFSNPVTTPCGHSFCKMCLRVYWGRSGSGECPLCRRTFSSRPHLSVNRILEDVTENYRKTRLTAKSKFFSMDELQDEPKNTGEVEQMIQDRLQKVEKFQCSLKLLKHGSINRHLPVRKSKAQAFTSNISFWNTCLKEVQESQRVFSCLLSTLEQSHKLVVAAVEQKQREAEKRVDRLVKSLEKEIFELKSGNTQPGHLDDKERLKKSFSQLPTVMRDWSKVTLETDPCVGFTRQAVVDFMDTVMVEAKRLSKAVDVTLNHRTAHPNLFISEDRKEVRHTNKRQEVPENPKRFDRVANVMAKEALSYGRHFWEVDVGDKTEWDLGVARQSVNRKGKFTICPANGFWTLSLKNGTQYVANTFPPTSLCLGHKPRKVAIYLNYGEGRVSFFCLDTGAHIHTFKDTFTDKLHPILSPGRPHGDKNTAPLIISSSCCSI
ncbi:bloodthirsty-related gene family, member 2 [Myxocyprinus asiaticus]|uniref:bloodthirsty-related gene family, member 2 n=1 Tax=Myxocyprinus asiaticus TaxID=70543 RepID=UPI0022225CE1|nr:bloodthirsty-related gene family, member 2 [Myxocyprinus asiaticus]